MSTALGLESAKTLRVIVPVGGTPTAAQELEIVAGSNITLTGTRTGNRVELSIASSGGGGGGGGGAPTGAEYLVGALNGSLTHERVVTDTATVTWDLATAGQAKASVPAASTSAAGVVELATSSETTAGLAVQASDTRLSDARTPTGAASGDLGGTYPSPTVTQARGLRETSGPTTLPMGAVAEGQLLRRLGGQIVGAYIVLATLTPSQSGPYNVMVGTNTGESFTGSTWV